MSFSLNLKVRDYECDMQGIVNNAIYQHYLEHARHEYLLSHGLSFAEMTRQGIVIVVVRAELDYRKSLRAGDEFQVTVKAARPTPVRLVFEQSILLDQDAPRYSKPGSSARSECRRSSLLPGSLQI